MIPLLVGCPAWALSDPNDIVGSTSICNELLTNKGWWILGADHQIREGRYVTTIKLALPAPGAGNTSS